jgi:hypothetical protein
MTLSSKEAKAHLSEAESAGRRSAQLYGYRKASPHLMLWGAIWVLGYGGTALSPHYANLIWAVLVLAGVAGGAWIGRCSATWGWGEAGRSPKSWRMVSLAAIAVFFVMATYSIMWPVHGAQVAAYPALITGTVYAAVGLWTGVRYVVTGILVVALTLFGFYHLQEYILWWLAVVGGGSMMLAGFWFRTA